MQSLDRVEFARNGANVFLVRRVDAIAPLARLAVEMLPVVEGSAGEEVVFNKVEWLTRPIA
jgi:hypothetical protein